MLQNTKELYGHKLMATDGAIGQVKDFYFDDKTWVIRYLVADTGSWLSGRQVLLSPHAFGRVDRNKKTFAIKLTRQQIEGSPLIEQHKPVSRQYEIDYYQYYGWPAYWNGGTMRGLAGYPMMMPPSKDQIAAQHHHPRDDKHLRSTKAVAGYAIHAAEGDIGAVSGFMIDEKSWTVRDLVVETGHWYAGKDVLVPATVVERISDEDSRVCESLTQAAIRQTAEDDVVKAGV